MTKSELNSPTITQVGKMGEYLYITYAAHLRAYAIYSAIYGSEQTAARLAQRGGFGEGELNEFYPEWRNHIVIKD